MKAFMFELPQMLASRRQHQQQSVNTSVYHMPQIQNDLDPLFLCPKENGAQQAVDQPHACMQQRGTETISSDFRIENANLHADMSTE